MPSSANEQETGVGSGRSEMVKAPGGAIRDIAMGLLLLTRDLKHDVKIRSIVVDTNVLLKDLGYLCRTGRQTTLLAESESGFVRLMVTPQVMSEVTEHIPTYAKNVRINPEAMFSSWAEYQRVLIVISPPRSNSAPVTKLAARDPDDVPTAELVELLAPELALSNDKDLQDLGFSQDGDWLPHVRHLSKAIERDAVSIAVRVGGTVLIVALSEAGLVLLRTVSAAIQRIPKRILWTLFASLAVLLLLPGTRKKIASFVAELLGKGGEFKPAVNQAIKNFVTIVQAKQVEWSQAKAFLDERHKHDSATPSSLRGYAIRVLAQSPYHLTPEEIVRNAQALVWRPVLFGIEVADMLAPKETSRRATYCSKYFVLFHENRARELFSRCRMDV